MKRSLIVVEPNMITHAQELIGLIRQYFPDYELNAVCLSSDAKLLDGDIEKLWVFDSVINLYDLGGWAKLSIEIANRIHFDLILVAATYWGRMLAPRIAAGLDVGLVADVTDVKINNEVVMVRPAYSGQLFASIVSQHCQSVMMTVRPGAFEPISNQRLNSSVEYYSLEIPFSGIEILSVEKQNISIDISKANLLVAGGAGSESYYARIKELAEQLDGLPAASRKIVDAGIMPRAYQVGHSGYLVKPALYIAIGIYGAVQHIEGIKKANNILSVNIDPQAAINSLARWVVIGDGETFIERFTNIIEKYRKEN
jgi:electron transfer flavoprotein alpha subunit